MRYSTITAVIDRAIIPALGDEMGYFELEAIARKTHRWVIDTDEDGNELLNTAGFEQCVSDDEFWSVVAQHSL